MVEGPGATRNGRKAQVAVGKVVISAECNSSSVIGARTSFSENGIVDIQSLLQDSKLCEAFTVGKELFLIFRNISSKEVPETSENDIALRLHFGMNGTLNTGRNGKEPALPHWRKNETFSLRIAFGLPHSSFDTRVGDKSRQPCISDIFQPIIDLTDDKMYSSVQNETNETRKAPKIDIIIEARRTTVSLTTTAISARTKYNRLRSSDVCSQHFLNQTVFENLTSYHNKNSTNISDAILNQSLFPGIGNIIKIESLHRAKIDPRRILASLSDEELKELIQHCRDFSMYWLNHSRTPEKKVYNKTTCSTCFNASVKMQKLGGSDVGNSLSRITFWCSICQPFYGQNNNILSGNAGEELRRKQTPNTIYPEKENQQIQSSISNLNNYVNKTTKTIINPYKKRGSMDSMTSTKCQSIPRNSIRNFNPHKTESISPNVPHNPYKKPCLNSKPKAVEIHISINSSFSVPSRIINPYRKSKNQNQLKSNSESFAPTCSQHGTQSIVLRRVHKEYSPNKQRIFYACNKQNCSFFAWADTHFPACKCHLIGKGQRTKRAVIKISKTSRTGGKWFLCCANGNTTGVGKDNGSSNGLGHGCGYFGWAESNHLDPIQNLLTPLL